GVHDVAAERVHHAGRGGADPVRVYRILFERDDVLARDNVLGRDVLAPDATLRRAGRRDAAGRDDRRDQPDRQGTTTKPNAPRHRTHTREQRTSRDVDPG